MTFEIEDSWRAALKDELTAGYFQELTAFVQREYDASTVYPPKALIFEAFRRTPIDSVKAVILGQDPYREKGAAQGLAFYAPEEITTPPSLRNIAKELQSEYSREKLVIPDLRSWADQGVLLLNTTLTVDAKSALSHAGHGWERFTDAVIRTLSLRRSGIVYFLWGNPSRKKAALIDRNSNLILESAHPSPLSAYRGFFGNGHFLACNRYLTESGQTPINW